MTDCLEKTLARYCGAVLLGKKPAALYSLCLTQAQTRCAANILAENGVCMRVMCQREKSSLVLFYEPQLLWQALQHSLAQKQLRKACYPLEYGLEQLLDHLQVRIAECECFPHEIGFFLGYPPADVVGFMLYGGQRFKHCDMWKVYTSVDKAKALCEEYRACCQMCLLHVEKGGSLQSARLCAHTTVG